MREKKCSMHKSGLFHLTWWPPVPTISYKQQTFICILDVNPVLDTCPTKLSSRSVNSFLALAVVPFAAQTPFLKLVTVSFINPVIVLWDVGDLYRKLSPVPMSWSVSLMHFYNSFKVASLEDFYEPFWVNSCTRWETGAVLYVGTSLPNTSPLLKMLSSLQHTFLAPLWRSRQL